MKKPVTLLITGILLSTFCILGMTVGAQAQTSQSGSTPPRHIPNRELADKALNKKVDALLAKMTLEEKVGQMVQFTANSAPVGPDLGRQSFEPLIANGEIGALNVANLKRATEFQRIAVEQSRLHIPLIFGLDVIHGYHTIFPIPLALAASFDPNVVTSTSRMAAMEASADGIRMTNSPMVDIGRDARWGRVAEGAGESPYLGSAMARAYVRGYQGNSLSDSGSIAACVKHFAAYGAAVAGRDYNAVDMSDIQLRQEYLPPYQAAIDAGAAVVMSAFNTLNSVPETADPYTLTEILRKEWGFDGFVRSDYNAVGELLAHGIASDAAIAARKSVLAGLDMDMASNIYHTKLLSLVRSHVIPESTIDEAVRRVLRVKFALGLFDHPYADESASPYQAGKEQRALALKAAEESFVLLRNQASDGRPKLLPISPSVKSIALIGPLADTSSEMLGTWYAKGSPEDVIKLRTALEQRMRKQGGKVLFSEGTKLLTDSTSGFDGAKHAAEQADLVVIALGEDSDTMIGEAASRANLDLPGNQEKLLEAVIATGKPVVLVVFSGRPLILNWAAEHVPAILEAWFPGIEAGSALTNVLFGDTNPSGKLPMSFPRAVGQEPLYLSQLPTGRPAIDVDLTHPPADYKEKFLSRYIDVPNSPLYPFGYGLSYTKFDYSPVKLNAATVHVSEMMLQPGVGVTEPAIQATATVRNSGTVTGTEIVQLYIRIRDASVEEPVRMLEGFQRITLSPGESKEVNFSLGFNELSIINTKSQRVIEPSDYTVFIGGDSEASQSAKFAIIQ